MSADKLQVWLRHFVFAYYRLYLCEPYKILVRTMEGIKNSEARKRIEEAQGIPEPRLLTENHPVYVGDMTEQEYRFANGQGVESLCHQFQEDQYIARIRAELAQL